MRSDDSEPRMSQHRRIIRARRLAGFTLLEMLIVAIILAVIAAIAIPRFTKTVNRTYRDQAQQVLLAIYHGERAYFFTNDTYYVPGNWRLISMDNPGLGSQVAYTLVAAGVGAGATFTATATYQGLSATITQAGPPVNMTSWP